MALKKVPEENPYAAPMDEDFLKSAWQYREHFEDEAEFQDALELWPRCPECGRRRVTRCPICKTSGDLFALADQEYFDPDAKPLEPPKRGGCGCGGHGCGHDCEHAQEEEDGAVIDVETEDARARRRLERRHAWARLGKKRALPTEDEPVPPKTPALICHVCSEAFVPVFPRYCEWCDHDFGEGEVYEVDGAVSKEVEDFLARKAKEEDAAFEPDSNRVLWTIAALIAGLALFMGYWFIIL